MSCGDIALDGSDGIAQALRSVDCLSRQATAASFDRLFGTHGALSQALTVVLAIYVALLALGLLSGRTGLRLSLLTPRALTVGLVLTFATSWIAYQQVVVNLAVGAPDEIARVLTGSRGPAVELYAGRLDDIFAAIAEAARAAAPGADASGRTAPVSPSSVLWLAAFLLLLGTAGLHIVAKLTLAALLAIGPVFIVLALFDATRGLFEGWLKSVLLFALVPLIGVLAGGGALRLIAPLSQSIAAGGSALTMQQAAGLLLVACVHLALMAIAVKAAAVLSGGWSLPRAARADGGDALPPAPHGGPMPGYASHAGHTGSAQALPAPAAPRRSVGSDERIRQIVAAGQRGRDDTGSGRTAHGPAAAGGPAGAATAPLAPLGSARRRTQGLVRTAPPHRRSPR